MALSLASQVPLFSTLASTAALPNHQSTWSSSNEPYHSATSTYAPSDAPSACSAHGASATAVTIPETAPSDAPVAPGDFVGFGFETAFLNNYASGDFSQNLITSVAKRIPGPITIRIGGTSGDRFEFDPNQSEIKVCIDGDCPVGSSASYIFGPSYFDDFSAFPDQKFSFQARMGPELNLTASLAYVWHAFDVLGSERTAAIALGNEPDIYDDQYNVTYTAEDYVKDALELEGLIVKTFGMGDDDQKIFQVGELAGAGGGDFSIANLFDAGLNDNGLVKFAAQHWYQVSTDIGAYTPETQQEYLLNHDAIASLWDSGYDAALEYVESNQPAVDYILSETGSALSDPPREWQSGFAATLWAAEFNLFALSQGVKRVDGTHRPAAKHSLWVPDDSVNDPALGESYNPGPQVRGPYFATPFVADFIGQTPGHVCQVLSEQRATAYAIYDPAGSVPARLALLNLNYWAADNGTRPSIPFAVSAHGETVTVRRLHADAGAAAQGDDVDGTTISWAGETWSHAVDDGNGHSTGEASEETVPLCDGVAVVEVPDSEAVIVYFE